MGWYNFSIVVLCFLFFLIQKSKSLKMTILFIFVYFCLFLFVFIIIFSYLLIILCSKHRTRKLFSVWEPSSKSKYFLLPMYTKIIRIFFWVLGNQMTLIIFP